VLRRSREPACQCELIALFEMRQSLFSHHIKRLTDAGLVRVESPQAGLYSVASDDLRELIAWLI
jgi:DNA-binding transcriptional ArsR family regulator